MMNKKIGISIIIATYNNPSETVEAILSIDRSYNNFVKRKSKEIYIELIISDNSTNQVTKSLVKNLRIPYCKYFKVSSLGTAYARNYGVKKSEYEYIAFTDSDCIVHKDWIKQIYLSIKKNNFPDVVQGVYFYPYDKKWFSISESNWDKVRWKERQADSRNLIIKKNIYLKIGRFDIKHFYSAGAEDLTLMGRLRKIGSKIIFDKKIIVYHRYPGFLGEIKRYLFYGKAAIHIKKYSSREFYEEFSPKALWYHFLRRISKMNIGELIYQVIKLFFFTLGYLIGKRHYDLEKRKNRIINPLRWV